MGVATTVVGASRYGIRGLHGGGLAFDTPSLTPFDAMSLIPLYGMQVNPHAYSCLIRMGGADCDRHAEGMAYVQSMRELVSAEFCFPTRDSHFVGCAAAEGTLSYARRRRNLTVLAAPLRWEGLQGLPRVQQVCAQ